MPNRKLVAVLAIIFLFAIVSFISAQQKPQEKKDNQTVMQYKDMQAYMDKIAADSTLRMQMMVKMMEYTKGNYQGMMQMYEMMSSYPEMHSIMMEMMGEEGMMNNGMTNHNMTNHNMMGHGMMNHNMNGDSTKQ